MHPLSFLFAVNHFVSGTKSTLISSLGKQVVLKVIKGESEKTVKCETTTINNLAGRINCALELIGDEPLPEEEAVGRWYLERLISEQIQSSSIVRKDKNYQLEYLVNGKKISTEVYPKSLISGAVVYEFLWFTAQAIKEGYRYEETIGQSIWVVTPKYIRRPVSSLTCDCKEYREVLKEKRPCLHLKMLEVFRRQRSLFRKYELLKEIL